MIVWNKVGTMLLVHEGHMELIYGFWNFFQNMPKITTWKVTVYEATSTQ